MARQSSGGESGNKANKWAALLNEVNSKSGGGPFFYPKTGRTRVRLLPAPGTEDDFFRETGTNKYGKKKTKYVLWGFIMSTDQGDLSDRWKGKAVPIVVSSVVLKAILGLLAEDYDLLSPEGHGITIVRSGQGLNTSYSVMPSQKPVQVPEDLKWPEETLDDYAEQYATSSADEGGSMGGDDDSSAGDEEGGNW